MKKSLLGLTAGAALGALSMAQPAHALLIADGVTYDLEESTINATTHEFVLKIIGENTASDTEGGRTGINAIAFGAPSGFATAVMLSPGSGYSFVLSGLSSSGCHGSGNFFCFDNTAIPPTPTTLLSGSILFDFEVTVNPGGTFTGYDPDFKIDWVGTKNNYDLVSKTITPDPVCADCSINRTQNEVPEPGALAIFGTALLGFGAHRYLRKGDSLRAQLTTAA